MYPDVPHTSGGYFPGTTSESMSITTVEPLLGSMSTLLQERSECASPAWCILRMLLERHIAAPSMVRKSPFSSGAMYFLSLPVNQLLFLSLPLRFSPFVEAFPPKKNFCG